MLISNLLAAIAALTAATFAAPTPDIGSEKLEVRIKKSWVTFHEREGMGGKYVFKWLNSGACNPLIDHADPDNVIRTARSAFLFSKDWEKFDTYCTLYRKEQCEGDSYTFREPQAKFDEKARVGEWNSWVCEERCHDPNASTCI